MPILQKVNPALASRRISALRCESKLAQCLEFVLIYQDTRDNIDITIARRIADDLCECGALQTVDLNCNCKDTDVARAAIYRATQSPCDYDDALRCNEWTEF